MFDATPPVAAAPLFDLRGRRVWVAGHRGMVGSALLRRLGETGCVLLTVDRARLDLRRADDVAAWLQAYRPDAVFVAAGTVGGIAANLARPAEFAHDNLAIAANIAAAAARFGVKKLMYLGSSCVYPRLAAQPLAEAALMTGPLEPSNEAYATAKLAGMALCRAYRRQHGCDFVSVVPTNLYGPGDNANPAANHVVPALIRKLLHARDAGGAAEIWGSGTPVREFLHVDDAAAAMVFLMQRYSAEAPINIGGGAAVSIRELAELLAEILGFAGELRYDAARPDGMPRKQLDAGRLLGMGWRPCIGLREGLAATCRWMEQAALQPA